MSRTFFRRAVPRSGKSAESIAENYRIFIVVAIRRKRTRRFVLMSQAGLGKMVETTIEVIGPEKIVLEPGGKELWLRVFDGRGRGVQ